MIALRIRTATFTVIASLLLTLLVGRPAPAAPMINVGTHELFADTPGQTLEIYVSGGDAVSGVNFNIQVADGGPETGGSIDGPVITGLDILTGTIFAASNSGSVNPEALAGLDYPQWESRTTLTAGGTVAASGLLATVTLDTTGFSAGQSFDLIMGGPTALNGPTDFAGLTAVITNGLINLVAAGIPGDFNGSGGVDTEDINPFILALTNPAGYATAYPDVNLAAVDPNGDDAINTEDINPFIAILTGGGYGGGVAIPEPISALWLALAPVLRRRPRPR